MDDKYCDRKNTGNKNVNIGQSVFSAVKKKAGPISNGPLRRTNGPLRWANGTGCVKTHDCKFLFQWLAARLWFGRARDYLDSEEWLQSSFVIGPRNDKDFVGYPSGATVLSPSQPPPDFRSISALSPLSFFPPPTFLIVAHTISLFLVTRALRAGPMLSPVDNRPPTNSLTYRAIVFSPLLSAFFFVTQTLTTFQDRWIEKKFISKQNRDVKSTRYQNLWAPIYFFYFRQQVSILQQ